MPETLAEPQAPPPVIEAPPTMTHPTGVMLTRGKWKAWEPCEDTDEDIERATSDLRARFGDWWRPSPPQAGVKRKPVTLLVQFGRDELGKFVALRTLDTISIPGDA